MFGADGQLLEKAQARLDIYCPSPEADIVKLSKIAAFMPDNADGARLRRWVLDIDDLIAQMRWHLGCVLLLKEMYPALGTENKEDWVAKHGVPSTGALLLREFIVDPTTVLYEDLTTPRRGAQVAGWILHMMVDSAVYRGIAVLDRMAHILWCAAGLPSGRVYFRPKNMRRIAESLKSEETSALADIAEQEITDFVLKYRDGLTHDLKVYSRLAGFALADVLEDSQGKKVYTSPDPWDADQLFALGNVTYKAVVTALSLSVRVCEKKWPAPANRPEK